MLFRALRFLLASVIVAGLVGCDDGPAAPLTGNPPVAPPGAPEASAQWVTLAPMPQPRVQPAAAALDGIVYVAGGLSAFSNPVPPTGILAYDPALNAWRVTGALTRGVRAPGMTAIGGRVYIVGGFANDPFAALDLLQIFDPHTGLTASGPPMPSRRGGLSVVSLDGRIHAIGGLTDDDFDMGFWVNAHEVYDPTTQTWSVRAPIPTHEPVHGSAVIGGKVYASAGLRGQVYVYDPAIDSWSQASAGWSASAWFGRAVAGLGGKLYVLGGGEWPPECCNGPSPRATVDRFDPGSATWQAIAPAPTPRDNHVAVVVGPSIHLIGGRHLFGDSFGSGTHERFTP